MKDFKIISKHQNSYHICDFGNNEFCLIGYIFFALTKIKKNLTELKKLLRR